MQLEGWRCLECGVVYAPFVKECRCSVKIQDNDVPVTCLHEWPGPETPCINCGLVVSESQKACFHNWPSTSSPCTKCGLKMAGMSFNVPLNVPQVDIVGCQHVYGDSSLTTVGRLCTKCGMQEVQWEKPGNTCSICGDTSGTSHTAFGTICGTQGETNG